MDDWQTRLVLEKDELNKKINKLEDFFFSEKRESLLRTDQDLLCVQLHAMSNYRDILNQRIARFS